MLQFETFLTRYRPDSYVLGKVMRLGSSTVTDREQSLSIGSVAALYESIRPGYPHDATHWALRPGFAIGRGIVSISSATATSIG